MEHVSKQLSSFKNNLEHFAKKHKHQINKNPMFRQQFQTMCNQVGVDPLASNKGFWAQLLGVGDFYYELAVQVIDVCLATQPRNGGLLSMVELLAQVTRRRGKNAQEVTEDDICRAIENVATLGNGFRVLKINKQNMVLSVPTELNRDHVALVELADQHGFVTMDGCKAALGWPAERLESVLRLLMEEGMVWVDEQMESGELAYWLPSLLGGSDQSTCSMDISAD